MYDWNVFDIVLFSGHCSVNGIDLIPIYPRSYNYLNYLIFGYNFLMNLTAVNQE